MKITKAGHSGILLPELKIGLDYSGNKADHVFISHAHADHMPRKKGMNVIATEATTRLMKLRGFNDSVHVLEFGESYESDLFKATFYPAGHILGSAMTFIESDLGNVLYTGDYRNPPSPASEGFSLPDQPVDLFITEATFALPIYKWKTNEEIADEIRQFAKDTLSENYTPVFLAYNLGKAQEFMFILKELNHPMQIHGAGFKLCKVYDEMGFNLGMYETYNRETCEGKILITPTSGLANGFASNVSKKRIAYCSGWAALESRRSQMIVDKLIPISDHIDFFELIDLCKKLDPKLVYITHTPNPAVVQHYLENAGIESRFLDLAMEEND